MFFLFIVPTYRRKIISFPKVVALMELTTTRASVILDMLEETVTLIMTTVVLLLASMVSAVLNKNPITQIFKCVMILPS